MKEYSPTRGRNRQIFEWFGDRGLHSLLGIALTTIYFAHINSLGCLYNKMTNFYRKNVIDEEYK
jgi:uncharacterized membrane protein YkvI